MGPPKKLKKACGFQNSAFPLLLINFMKRDTSDFAKRSLVNIYRRHRRKRLQTEVFILHRCHLFLLFGQKGSVFIRKKNYITIVTHTLPQKHAFPINNEMYCISNPSGNCTLHLLSVSNSNIHSLIQSNLSQSLLKSLSLSLSHTHTHTRIFKTL